MNVIRKTIPAGQVTEFAFNVDVTHFVVKNLTDNRIYACLGNTYVEEESITVLPLTSDNLIINEDEENSVRCVQIYSEYGGEVEVQCLQTTSIFTDISENLLTILNATYGKDVRKAIHDSIQTIYNAEQSLEDRISRLEDNEE